MFNIDQYTYSNKLRNQHPGEKFFFAVTTMVICLAASSMITSLVVTFMMAGAVILRAGIPWRFYVRLMAVPLSFLLVGAATIAVSVVRQPDSSLYGISLHGITVGVSARDLVLALQLFFKSLGAVSCLYFLSLTTPMLEIISVLKRMKVPLLFIELMGLIYRFIFVVMETAEKIYTSQSCRWGYATVGTSLRSLGQLASTLFVKSYHRSQMLFTTLISRGYTGGLNVLEPRYLCSKKNILMIGAIDLALAALAFYTGGGFIDRIYS